MEDDFELGNSRRDRRGLSCFLCFLEVVIVRIKNEETNVMKIKIRTPGDLGLFLLVVLGFMEKNLEKCRE